MSLPKIIALLRETLGLDVASVGNSLIERAVKRRMIANNLPDILPYAHLLECSELELQSLCEAVVIPETFFFRYPESFAGLRQILGGRFHFGTQKLRALSVPCSTGEEPYSIAMTLLDLGWPPEKFEIDAMDISAESLDLARLGLFGNNSFRGSGLEYRNQYFLKTDAGFRLCDQVRECVKFKQGNILQEGIQWGAEPYDFIFCRNLLIYFYNEARGRALKSLRQLLTPDGLLFVGPAETALLSEHRFSTVKLPMTFAFRKSESMTSSQIPAKRKPENVWLPSSARRREVFRQPNLAIPTKAMPKTAKQEVRLVPDLDLAQQLADQGQVGEAAEICELSLREQGPTARAFYLLGLIRDGAGDQPRASEFYRKALYLEPDHYDALIHFALLKDQSGDGAWAKALKDRARRVLEQTR
jgi:chemotaxis protein methyltransferase WspC